MSPPTQYRLYIRETVFTGQKTQPTVSKYWRNRLSRHLQFLTSGHSTRDWTSECPDVKYYKWKKYGWG